MAPKVVPKRAASKGRGGGRGAANVSQEPSADAPLIQPQSGSSNQPDPLAPIITTPQHPLNSSEPSPNSSPATIPTETPAPTPARPTQPEPSVPIAHGGPSSSSRGGRGGFRGGMDRPAAAPSRFKPKNIRRSAKELEEIARKENERIEKAAEKEAKAAERLERGRGRGAFRGGRGGAMGERPKVKTTASGVFGQAPALVTNNAAGPARIEGGSGGSGGGGGGSGSGGGGGSSGINGVKREKGDGTSFNHYEGSGDYEVVDYPNEPKDVKSMSIDYINISDSEDEEDSIQVLGSRSRSRGARGANMQKSLKPVRLARHEHQERVLLVNTDAGKIKKEEDSDEPMIDESRSSSKRAREDKGVQGTSEGVRIKHEPGTTPEPEDPPQIKESPETQRRNRFSTAAPTAMMFGTQPAPPDAPKARVPPKRREQMPVHQTEEDREEYKRHQEDIEILLKELAGMQAEGDAAARGKGKGKAQDDDGDVEMKDAQPVVADKTGRLYLFQFPPVLPELYNPSGPKPKTPLEIKREKQAAKEAEEAAKSGKGKIKEEAGSKGKGKAKNAVDRTAETAVKADTAVKGDAPIKPEPAVKTEEGVETPEEKARREGDEKHKNKKMPVVHEEGFVGKMIVRESGRVELIWGGTTMLVDRGAGAAFLTTGVIIDSVEKGPAGGGAPEGTAYGMGPIMGKFVVSPDWRNYDS